MLKQQPREMQTGPVSHIDDLLSLLRAAIQHDPPPALRTRLAQMSSERLGGIRPGRTLASQQHRPGRLLAATGFAVATIVCAAFIGLLLNQLSHRNAANRARSVTPAIPAVQTTREVEAPPAIAKSERQHRRPAAGTDSSRLDHLVIPLPYSDGAIRTGTGATIRVSLSQGELLSMGVPVSPTADNRRFIADLILGGDGLPRAISVPFPLTAVGQRR